MRRRWLLLTVVFSLLFLITSCSTTNTSSNNLDGDYIESPGDSQKAGQAGNTEKLISEHAGLDNLLDSFSFPARTMDNFEPETDGQGLPVDLVNDLKKAVYMGDSESFIKDINDESLMITADDFLFKPNTSEEADITEMGFNEKLKNDPYGFLIYQCDIDGDGADEIIMIENLKYDYSGSNIAYLLKKSGDSYVFSGYDYLGYYRCLAIFAYDGGYYLIANYDDYKTRTSKAVGLFGLGDSKSGFMWLLNQKHIYIRKTNNGYRYHLLYKNEEAPIGKGVQDYIDEIKVDLIYTDRNHKTFYGNEKDRYDLLDEARENNSDWNFWNLYGADVDNDGKDEVFDRKVIYNGLLSETEINWYDPESKTVCNTPYDAWSPKGYYRTQMWTKIIDNKTVVFTLYHKVAEDIYLLDARLQEDGRTNLLMDYMINLEENAELSDYWDYDDSNWVQTDYDNPDAAKALTEDVYEAAGQFAKKVQEPFEAVGYHHENIPEELILLAEKALSEGKFYISGQGTVSCEITLDDFNKEFGQDMEQDYDQYVEHIYKYSIDNVDYYLTVADSRGSARLVDVNISKEADGKLVSVDYLTSLDLHAEVVEYENKFYLIEGSYNYYSKNWQAFILTRLLPGECEDYVMVGLEPKEYFWEKVYSSHMPYDKAIDDYIDGIKLELMEKSQINDDIEVFEGDEKPSIDQDKLLRLKSVGGDYPYYEIDFNNDGEKEYFTKHFWFPSNYTILNLIVNFYQFTDSRIVEMNGDFYESQGMLIQLWFKEIEGNIFAFRLQLIDGDKYLLDVFRTEGSHIDQVQTYIIVPNNKISVTSGEYK